ncbi:vesicular transport-associated repeat protein [Trypanosoma grayi]|uniref:vesicular transport-associated repeat protein n=1 Tax=Trypanosoma grayi TaxID=71804 RepID=UPI0004F407C3|nr:vesicular transport-associated repeat protein [Trypanosoma grayi]KEG14327.1 vesicular transport-associated repeat protein [Trypanosoma grayi]
MWGFFNEVRAAVRQTIAPTAGTNGEEQKQGERQQPPPPLPKLTEIGDRLSEWWDILSVAASTAVQNAMGDSTSDGSNEPPPPLLRLSVEERAGLPSDELFRGLTEAVSIIAARSNEAHKEARFLLSLSLEEQIAHTSDFLNCYQWWEKLVNKRLAICQEIVEEYKRLPEREPDSTILLLTQRIHGIRAKCLEDMANIAARGRLLREERYDFLNLPNSGGREPADSAHKQAPALHPQTAASKIKPTEAKKEDKHDTKRENDYSDSHSTIQLEVQDKAQKLNEDTSPHLHDGQIRRQAGEEARHLVEEEARLLAEEEARRKAQEEARRHAEEEARLLAEEEARRQAEEEARRQAEEEARRQAQEEARRQAQEEARRQAEEEARRQAAEKARLLAEEEARRQTEEEARHQAEEEARHQAEKEARRFAENSKCQKRSSSIALSPDVLSSLEHDGSVQRIAIVRAQQDAYLTLARDFVLATRLVEQGMTEKASSRVSDADGWGDDEFEEVEVHYTNPSPSRPSTSRAVSRVQLEENDNDEEWGDW